MKHKISTTIVVDVGIGATVSMRKVSEDYEEVERKPAALKSLPESTYSNGEEIASVANSPTKISYYNDEAIAAYTVMMMEETLSVV